MKWQIAESKQRFSELIRSAERGPQLIFNRARLVAAVIDRELYEEFVTWKATRQKKSLGEELAELRKICAEEGYRLEVPRRKDRPNPFA